MQLCERWREQEHSLALESKKSRAMAYNGLSLAVVEHLLPMMLHRRIYTTIWIDGKISARLLQHKKLRRQLYEESDTTD